jgi:hypothetical protein
VALVTIEEAPGRLSLRAPLADRLRNVKGQLFGGFTPTMLDLIGSFTVHAGEPKREMEFPYWLSTVNLDPVTGVLVDGSLEAVNSLAEDREEAIHDLVPLFGIYLLGKGPSTLHVGEEHGDLLALAFERTS